MRRHLPLEEKDIRIAADQDLRSLGLNSLRAVDVLVTIEDTFCIMFPDEALTEGTFRNVENLTAVVTTLLVPPPAAEQRSGT